MYRLKFLFLLAICCFGPFLQAQHMVVLAVDVDNEKHTLSTGQYLLFANQTQDTIASILLNDWGNAYSRKDTPLGKRFSDEFVRSFHYAPDMERGATLDLKVTDIQQLELDWFRPEGHPDLVEIPLPEPLYPGETATLFLSYVVKLPSDRFTGFGYSKNGTLHLRNFFLMPARYENGKYTQYSNLNLDDAANALCDISMTVNVKPGLEVFSDLDNTGCLEVDNKIACNLSGIGRRDFTLAVAPRGTYHKFSNDKLEIWNSLDGRRTGNIQKAVVVDRVAEFVHEVLGDYPHSRMLLTQEEYDRNPFYGLNQLPSFINVFSDDFIYELKFLKTYTHLYLKNTLSADHRADNWIYDAVQMYVMMAYIDFVHPQIKATGGLANVNLLRGYRFIQADFNEQYYYLWLLMARKNLDQPLAEPQDKLIRFNEQIAGKYYAGLALKYLDSYLGNGIVAKSVREFVALNQYKEAGRADFEAILKGNAGKNIDWFFEEIVNTRKVVDYKFKSVEKKGDIVVATISNNSDAVVPMPVYLLRKDEVVGKQWFDGFLGDSTIAFRRHDADKIVLNYRREVPEFNERNNWRSLKDFRLGNKPLKFTFFKDIEDPSRYQVLFVPTLFYNLYDGLSPGLRFYNKTLLDRPFNYDINPMYSSITQTLTGQLSFTVNQYFRDSNLYNARFSTTMSYFHYAPDAGYTRLNPTLLLRIRPSDFRNNRKETIMLREVIVHRESSEFVVEDTDDYAVFNARYVNTNAEITGLTSFQTDFQAAAKFGKMSGEIQFRRVYNDNRMLSLRAFAGFFLYNKTSNDFFSFALDRATDYLFDYNYYGRSETTGLFSQQLILAEGGFKSQLEVPFANQWISSFNAGFSIWNWVEVYGDVGLVKIRNRNPWLAYDTGVRLNLVPDYFELYLPVYSNNGWETSQPRYAERIRFIVTLTPNTLISLFTRKWF